MLSEHSGYFKSLASTLKGLPREERPRVVEEAKGTPEYWQAKSEHVKNTDEEEPIDDGLGLLLKKKRLYHGSGSGNIKDMEKAEHATMGRGVYFTSTGNEAIGYARKRAQEPNEFCEEDESITHGEATIYECEVRDVRMIDLRKKENLKKIMDGFVDFLRKILRNQEELVRYNYGRRTTYLLVEDMSEVIDLIEKGDIGRVGYTRTGGQIQNIFSDYIASLGYEGVVTFEGGEPPYVLDHDTYMIIDPKKIKIISEHKIV